MNRTFDNLNELASLIRNSPDKFVIFLGAGACVSAGLPLGDTLRDIILETIYGSSLSLEELRTRFYEQFPEAKNFKEFTLEVVNHFFIQRHGVIILDLLKNIFNKYKLPPIGYSNLKKLIKKDILKKIITVNFDELLEKALNELNVKAIGVNSDLKENVQIWKDSSEPILLKLHGTISNSANLKASLDDVKILPKDKSLHLEYLIGNHSIIFVGYSGRDNDIISCIKHIVKNKNYIYKFYLISPSEEEMHKNLLKIASSENNFLKLESDAFLGRLKGLIIGEDSTESLMHKELSKRGFGVKRVIWTPGIHHHYQNYIDTVEVVIYQPNVIPDSGPIESNVGDDTHEAVMELSKKHYRESKFWITHIYSNRDHPRCKTFCTSIPKFHFGGASIGDMLPKHLSKYILH